MAIKFFKTLGLSKLFKKNTSKNYHQTSSVSADNLTDDSKSLGVTQKSIVHITAQDGDAAEYGGRFITGTNVLWIQDQPFFDSKNILFGISMQCRANTVYITAPKGVLKEGDYVVLGRFGHNQLNGWTVPAKQFESNPQHLPLYTFNIQFDTGSANRMIGNTQFFKVQNLMETLQTALSNLQEEQKSLKIKNIDPRKYTLGLSVWRDNVRISEWMPFEYDYDYSGSIQKDDSGNPVYNVDNLPEKEPRLKLKKGLYLPGIQNVTYNKLLVLIAQNRLVPGRQYCMTDYEPSSVKADLIVATTEEHKLYLTALTNNTLSENGILVYGNQLCEVKYGLKKNRWSTEWTFSENAEVNDGGNFNIEATGQGIELTWKVISKNSVPDDNKSVVIDFGLEEPLLWIHTYVDNSDSLIAGTDLYAVIQQSDLYPNDSIMAYCYEPTTLGLAIQFLIDIDPQYLIPFYTNTYKGEVYWMRDPYNNEATYDFKGYKVKVGNTNFWTFSDSNENDGSRNGKCTNNRILYEGYYNVFAPDVHNLVLNTKYNIQQIDTGTIITFNNKIFANGYIIPGGTSSEFLMANGSTLKGIDATATKLDASADPTVNFNNSTFNFGIPSGQDGSKWYSGTAITGTNTTGTKFTSSGITAALAKDKYYNTDTCNIYECVTGGNASTATWKYIGNIKGDTGSVANIEDGTSGEVVTGLTLSNGTITMNKGSVGGRNLLKENKWSNATKTSDSYLGNPVYSCTYPTSNAPSNGLFDITYSDDLNGKFANGEYVTVSFYAKSSTNITDIKGGKIAHHFYNIKQATTGGLTSGTTSSWGYSNSNIIDGATYNIPLTTTWKKYSITWKLDDQNAEKDNITISLILIRLKEGTKGTTIYFSNVKLEKGSVPTDWSVAPEEGDLYNNSASPTITVGGIGPSTNLQNKTMKEMFDLLLYPVVAFKDLYVQVSPSSFEYNTKPNSITYTAKFTAGSKDVSYIWDNDKTKTSNSITITPTAKLTSGPRHSVTVSDTSAGGTTTLSASGAPGITYRWFFGLGTETTPALGTVGSLGTSVTKRDYPLQGDTTNYKVWLLYPNITGWTMPTILNMGAPFNDYAEINGVTYNGLSYKAFKFNPEYKAGETKFTLQ